MVSGPLPLRNVSDVKVKPPSLGLLALEPRALFEMGAFAAASPLLRCLGRGDRHPVLVLPGFSGDDLSTQPLRWFLRGQGYWTHGWRLGANMGPSPETLEGIARRLETVHQRHGRKVSLIGWSLGGIYARQLARQFPRAVRQVITLGSPFRLRPGDESNASSFYDRYGHHDTEPPAVSYVAEDQLPRLKVPSTAVYSRTDGVVRWHACIDAEGPRRENVEVQGSHSGLGHNPAVMIVIADRLSQPEGEWRPFRPPVWAAHLYPKPVNWLARPA